MLQSPPHRHSPVFTCNIDAESVGMAYRDSYVIESPPPRTDTLIVRDGEGIHYGVAVGRDPQMAAPDAHSPGNAIVGTPIIRRIAEGTIVNNLTIRSGTITIAEGGRNILQGSEIIIDNEIVFVGSVEYKGDGRMVLTDLLRGVNGGTAASAHLAGTPWYSLRSARTNFEGIVMQRTQRRQMEKYEANYPFPTMTDGDAIAWIDTDQVAYGDNLCVYATGAMQGIFTTSQPSVNIVPVSASAASSVGRQTNGLLPIAVRVDPLRSVSRVV